MLLVPHKELNLIDSTEDYSRFKIPDNFYDFSNVSIFGSKGDCKNKRLYPFEIKNFNLEEVLIDEFQKPSFLYREVPYFLQSNSVTVYKDNFEISKVNLQYYRQPRRVEIAGYTKNGTPTKDVHPEFSDKTTRKIIEIAAREFQFNNVSNAETETQRPIIKP